MKIQLKNEMETLLIPLYGKAKMSKIGIFKDKFAEATVDKLEYDYSKLKIQNKTQIMLAMRASIFDNFAKRYLEDNLSCLVLHLGCGLDSRFMRLGLNVETWYDLDFSEVINIKKQLYPETENYKYISSSVIDFKWMDNIKVIEKEILIIAEGLFMYLSEGEIIALLEALKSKFKRYTIIFDAFSKLTAKKMKNHTSLKKTDAIVKWGIDDPREIESYNEAIKYLRTIYLTDENVIKMLPKNYQILFKLAGIFKSTREAHRVFVMNVRDRHQVTAV